MIRIIIIAILAILLATSCREECGTKVVEMNMKSITVEKTVEKAMIDGYYYSEFQSGTLNIELSFYNQGAGEFCDYYWISYPLDNGLTITTKDSIIIGENIIFPNESINDYLIIQNLEENFNLKYLITLKPDVQAPKSGTYQFNGKLELDDGVILTDSCLIKFN
jgi:hypothetical protein